MSLLDYRHRKYGLDNPAESFRELMLYLMENHHSNFVYRGQNKDYGTMIPSLFRKVKTISHEGFLLFPQTSEWSNHADTVRGTLAYVMLSKFGNVVGSYLAQQYCALSGCIDVTDRVDIAGFFATMCYPHYQTPIDDPEQIGVIYRFDRSTFPGSVKPSGVKDNPYDKDAQPGSYEVYTNHDTVANLRTTDFAFQKAPSEPMARLYTLEENITTFSDISPFLDDIDRKHRVHFPKIPEGYSQFSRARAQQGGMIQPKYVCRCPDDMEKDLRHLGDTIGFEDIYGLYGMQTFYFKHRGQSPKYVREEIWPAMWSDGTFSTICLILKKGKEAFMIGSDLQIKDIVDIGYQDNPHLTFDDVF